MSEKIIENLIWFVKESTRWGFQVVRLPQLCTISAQYQDARVGRFQLKIVDFEREEGKKNLLSNFTRFPINSGKCTGLVRGKPFLPQSICICLRRVEQQLNWRN